MEINHFSHANHPLILKELQEDDGKKVVCYGCKQPVLGSIYCCSECKVFLHKSCADSPFEIMHAMHPQHPLELFSEPLYYRLGSCLCDICGRSWNGFTYHCSECEFDVDVLCAQLESTYKHTCHHHPLKLQQRKALFKCDACGERKEDQSYDCTLCSFWIHKTCGSLATSSSRKDHPHPLSLAYCVPEKYRSYKLKCDICREDLDPKYWVYHCDPCRYVIHLKCMTSKSQENEAAEANTTPARPSVSHIAETERHPPREGGALDPTASHLRAGDEANIEGDRSKKKARTYQGQVVTNLSNEDFDTQETTGSLPDFEESFSDDDEDVDSSIPYVGLTASEKQRIRRPWKNALIIKLMGKTVEFKYLQARIRKLWLIQGQLNMVDLGMGFFAVRFSSIQDYEFVLRRGPWLIMDHYLTVRKWEPEFRPSSAAITWAAVWVRFPELPIEYYDESVLLKLGGLVGKPLKIDKLTEDVLRGKFARVAVQVDLNKSLLSKFRLRKAIQRIEYEGVHMVCFHCGKYGHKQDFCPEKISSTDTGIPAERASEKHDSNQGVSHHLPEWEQGVNFGDWMIVQRRPPARRYNATQNLENEEQRDMLGLTVSRSRDNLTEK